MTVEQKQHLLAYLGYYVGDIDGIWGTLSKTAMNAFKADFNGLDVPGIPENAPEKALKHAVAYDLFKTEPIKDETGTFWDEIEHFTREEFRCQCGGKYCNGFPKEPEKELVRTCDEIRRRLDVPVSIVDAGGSGVRCPQHNANVGGVTNSNHLYGKAADLHSSKSPEEMARVAEEVMGSTGEIGIYSWGIHIAVNCKYSRFYG